MNDLAECDLNPDLFFDTKPTAIQAAKAAREVCPRVVKCLEDIMRAEAGIGAQSRHGVCGGLASSERWALDRKRRAEAREAAAS